MSVDALRRRAASRPSAASDPPRTDTRRSATRSLALHATEASRALAERAVRAGRRLGTNAAQRVGGELAAEAERLAAASTVAVSSPAERRIAQRLDDFMQKLSGPYLVGGHSVRVPSAFRMVGGMNQLAPQVYSARIARALTRSRFRELAPIVGTVVSGKGSPDEVRKLTQALVDSPAFDAYRSLPAQQAVRALMWHFGIGMDCSGYVHRAFLYSRGSGDASAPASQFALGNVLASNIQHMPTGAFERVSPSAARAGDIVVLTHGPDGTGHKVIVHDRERVVPGGALHRALERELGSGADARIDLFRVDSSWGAGGAPEQGGIKRETWAYDESNGKWATLVQSDDGRWYASASRTSGPYDHDLQGFYRPKAED